MSKARSKRSSRLKKKRQDRTKRGATDTESLHRTLRSLIVSNEAMENETKFLMKLQSASETGSFDPSWSDEKGFSLLYWACFLEQPTTVSALLLYGCPIGVTEIHGALRGKYGREIDNVMDILLSGIKKLKSKDRIALLNTTVNDWDGAALHLALGTTSSKFENTDGWVRNKDPAPFSPQYYSMVKTLLSAKADPCVKYRKGRSVLHLCAENDWKNLCEMMLAANEGVSALILEANDDGISPLDVARKHSRDGILVCFGASLPQGLPPTYSVSGPSQPTRAQDLIAGKALTKCKSGPFNVSAADSTKETKAKSPKKDKKQKSSKNTSTKKPRRSPHTKALEQSAPRKATRSATAKSSKRHSAISSSSSSTSRLEHTTSDLSPGFAHATSSDPSSGYALDPAFSKGVLDGVSVVIMSSSSEYSSSLESEEDGAIDEIVSPPPSSTNALTRSSSLPEEGMLKLHARKGKKKKTKKKLARKSKETTAPNDDTSAMGELQALSPGVAQATRDFLAEERNQYGLAVVPLSAIRCDGIIGEGAFSEVRQGTWYDVPCAIKLLRDQSFRDVFWHEAVILEKVGRHPNVITFYGAVVTPEEFYLVTQLYDKGSLHAYTRECLHKGSKVPLSMALSIALDVSLALTYLHALQVIHRDIAARNILLDGAEYRAVIADFGLSRILADDTMVDKETLQDGGVGVTSSNMGPIKWMAPENITASEYSKKSDVWSYGVLLWEILSCEEPFADTVPAVAALGIGRKKWTLPTGGMDRFLVNIMQQCWNQDPRERPDISDIYTQIRHRIGR